MAAWGPGAYAPAMPKTPEQLKAELEARRTQKPVPAHEREAEGPEVEPSSERDFFANLDQLERETLGQE